MGLDIMRTACTVWVNERQTQLRRNNLFWRTAIARLSILLVLACDYLRGQFIKLLPGSDLFLPMTLTASSLCERQRLTSKRPPLYSAKLCGISWPRCRNALT